MKALLRLVCALLVSAVSVIATPPVVPAAAQASIRQRVDYGYNPGIAVGILSTNGRTFFAYGVGDLETRQPLTEQSLFEIGSVTKVFTSTLLARLIQTGEVALTNRVRDFLPTEISVPSRNGVEINLEHLATHTSGLPYMPPNLSGAYLDNPFADYTSQKLYDFLNTYALSRIPGAAYEYSNVGVGLLGYALALRVGVSYEQLLRERVLDPLGLHDTRITLSTGQEEHHTTGHSGVTPRPRFMMDSLAAAGSLSSSVSDLLTFLEFYAGLRTNDFSAALADATTYRRATDIPGINIGLNWWLLPYGSDTIVFHEGNTLGSTAFIGYRRATKKAVVVLTNSRVNQYANVEDIGLSLLGYPLQLNTIQKPAVIPLATIRKYQGFYKATDGTYFDVRLTNNFLTFSFSNASNLFSTFYPQSTRQVQVLDPGVDAFGVFNTNAAGKVTSLTWNQNGIAGAYLRETAPARLAISADATITLSGDSQLTYALEQTSDFRDWQAFSTNTIWTNRVRLPTEGSHHFIRAAVKD